MNENLRKTVENILGCDLASAISMPDKIEAEDLIDQFLHTVVEWEDQNALARMIDPQWVILAAGKGTRIDPSGGLSKTLDVWFGGQNTLQLSRRYLPGSRPHIVVINDQMAERVASHRNFNGVIPASALDQAAVDSLFGPNAILCVQPEKPYGTGAALQAALPAVLESDAEFIGVAFGDEPFLNRAMYLQTLISHFIATADVTLCGKIPETVVDKGGLFFDSDGKFIGTKEWYDMTDAEKSKMWHRLERGEAYTNTGITLIRRSAAIERMDRLGPHGNKSELHHVDLIRHCYEDGLKTHAHIYRDEIISGVNRWSNVLVGEEFLFEQTRRDLVGKGVRVDPAAQITLEGEEIEIGHGCYLLGRIHLGTDVRLGNYCRLENVVLLGDTTVGDLVGLKNVNATDTVFASNTARQPVATPIIGLAVLSHIENCHLERVRVGHSVNLKSVDANTTVIPAGISISHVRLGVPNNAGANLPLFGLTGEVALDQLALPGYKPGVFTLGEKRGTPDWENLRKHVQSHSERELIERATHHPILRQVAVNAVNELLEMKTADGIHATDELTAEEIWGSIFEIVSLCTGNPDPYRKDKLTARHMAINLLDEFAELELSHSKADWVQRLKLVIAANIIDYSSARVVAKLDAQPDYFIHALREAIHAPFSIDCFDAFHATIIEGQPKRLIWLTDNDGEIVFDLWFIQLLAGRGHQITVVGKESPASNDATLNDLLEVMAHPRFQKLQEHIALGHIRMISSASKTIGTNLYQANAEFANALLDADLVISKGQGNFYTTQGLKRDTFYLLLSKGMTAERTTGVVPNRDKAIDGLILAYVPGGTQLNRTLKEFCLSP